MPRITCCIFPIRIINDCEDVLTYSEQKIWSRKELVWLLLRNENHCIFLIYYPYLLASPWQSINFQNKTLHYFVCLITRKDMQTTMEIRTIDTFCEEIDWKQKLNVFLFTGPYIKCYLAIKCIINITQARKWV